MSAADHGHCKGPACYNRIQFIDTCSRCGGPVTFAAVGAGCCDLNPLDHFKEAVGYTQEELTFAISWGVAAMTDDFIDLNYEDTKDPGSPGEDAERAKEILQDVLNKILPDCGEDFMAGTICSLAQGHDGPHAPVCRRCGVDWYANNGCACPTT